MPSSKTDKKTRKKHKQALKARAEGTKLDIMQILRDEPFDTKPRLAKILDQYVELMSVVVSNGKILFYPTVRCSYIKILARFIDGHELMYSESALPGEQHCILHDDLEEIKLSKEESELAESFFTALRKFKFIKDPGCWR